MKIVVSKGRISGLMLVGECTQENVKIICGNQQRRNDMDYKELIEHLNEWNENLISEMCADDVLTCDDLCGCTGDCIVVQAATAIADLLSRAEAAESRVKVLEAILRMVENIHESYPPDRPSFICIPRKSWQSS
ncbi:MAG: hypothetical protein V8T45_04220 [Oscillospiraceae bacterium]